MASYDANPDTLSDFFLGMIGPGFMIYNGIYYFLATLLESPGLAIRDFQAFRHKAFAKFWAVNGKGMSEEMPADTMALMSTASGVVLDIGPGTGELLHTFRPDQVTKIYGPEPAVDMHSTLLTNIKKAGLEDKYVVLAAGAESSTLIPALAKSGLFKADAGGNEGFFDTIMCIRVLCGVPHQEETAKDLYRLLKPGGRMLVCEHVVHPWPNRGTIIGRLMQKVYVLAGWSFWLGGCSLNRDTETVLKRVGGKDGWKKFDLMPVGSWHPIPFVVGELIKND